MEQRHFPDSTRRQSHSDLEVASQQGGLEVVIPDNFKQGHDAPIFVESHKPYAKNLESHYHQQSQLIPKPPAPPDVPFYRRKKLVVAGVVLLLVVLGAVLGGVLGSRRGSSSSGDGGASSSNDTFKGEQIRDNSKLAVTGFYNGEDYGIQVFYQGRDKMLRYSLFLQNFGQWTPPIDITDNVDDGTPLATCTFYNQPDPAVPSDRQVQFYYVSDGNMTGSNWRASNSGPGTQDSVNDADIGVGRNTQLACYWPTHVFQHENGTLMQVLYNSGWDLSALDVKAAKNTPLVVLPLRGAHYSQTPANEQNQTDGRIVYRAEDGRLRTYDWQNGTQIESSPLPAKIGASAGLAAFASKRSASSDDVNTWVLYQDSDGSIMYLKQDIATDWNDPQTNFVFQDADNPTNIACVTPATSSSPGQVLLKASFETSFCYFQAGGKLKQVKFDGEKWSVEGFVPIP